MKKILQYFPFYHLFICKFTSCFLSYNYGNFCMWGKEHKTSWSLKDNLNMCHSLGCLVYIKVFKGDWHISNLRSISPHLCSASKKNTTSNNYTEYTVTSKTRNICGIQETKLFKSVPFHYPLILAFSNYFLRKKN